MKVIQALIKPGQKGGYTVFSPPPFRCGTESQGVNEGAHSGQQRSTTGSQHQIMSESNTIAASTADQVSSSYRCFFLGFFFFFNFFFFFFCFKNFVTEAGTRMFLLYQVHLTLKRKETARNTKAESPPQKKEITGSGQMYIIFRS